ncbi:MAG: hypothetical protein ACI4JT_05415 [Oscillospiraceae bacterium]
MNAAVNVANGCGQRQMVVNTAAMVAENRDRARFRGCEQAWLAMSESRDGSTRKRGKRCRVEKYRSSGLVKQFAWVKLAREVTVGDG